jgi:hypothetical protein
MKLFLSLVAVATAVLAPTSAASHAQSGLRRALDTTVAPANNKGSNEICLPGGEEPLSKSKAALLQSLASRVVSSNSSKKSGSGGGIIADAEGRPPTYVFGCGFLDFDCYECDLCQDAYGLLLETGSQVACDAACLGIVEAAGGGPEDRTFLLVPPARLHPARTKSPHALLSCVWILFFVSTAVADAVAVECVPLCEDIFSAVGEGTALSTCTLVGLC